LNQFLITIDVEDWFQVENFKAWIPFDTWAHRELRVEQNVHRLLDLFDSINSTPNVNPSTPEPLNLEPGTLNREPRTFSPEPLNPEPGTLNPRTTIFILGWIAERLPHLVREIQRRGHEVASHGFCHDLPQKLSQEGLQQDLEKSRKLLEDITGSQVVGYRAPSFAIDATLIEALAQAGYRYDSSYNSFALHGRYGKLTLPSEKKNGVAVRFDNGLFELPVSNLRLWNRVLPWAGGGYFRLIPAGLFIRGVRSILRRDGAYVFYMHPWEVDPGQPRVAEANRWFKFRHYINLDRTEAKLRRMIESFPQCRFVTCREYLSAFRVKKQVPRSGFKG
jgi:polysaccharide deacetylase family protein (PEP-CTERM system associated)